MHVVFLKPTFIVRVSGWIMLSNANTTATYDALKPAREPQ